MPTVSRQIRNAGMGKSDACTTTRTAEQKVAEPVADFADWIHSLQLYSPPTCIPSLKTLPDSPFPVDGDATAIGGWPLSGPPARLFNSARCAAYEVRRVDVSLYSSACVVFMLCRAQLDEERLPELVRSTLRRRLAFTPPTACVAWRDVVKLVETCGCAGTKVVTDTGFWDLRLLYCTSTPVGSTSWLFTTPPLRTARERTLFLNTDVDALFGYHRTPALYMCLEPSPVAGVIAETTPQDCVLRKTAPQTPAAPHRALMPPFPQAADEGSMVRSKEGSPEKKSEPLHSLPPRSLADSFCRAAKQTEAYPTTLAVTTQTETRAETKVAASAKIQSAAHTWGRCAFACQLLEWQRLQSELRPQLEGRVPPQALQVLRAELSAWAQRPQEEWNGSWIISLREHECDVLLDAAGYAAVRGGGHMSALPLPPLPSHSIRTVERYLARCQRLAGQTRRIVDRILCAAEERERVAIPQKEPRRQQKKQGQLSLTNASDFPFALQRVLLLGLLLRTLRHRSVVEAIQGTAEDRQEALSEVCDVASRMVAALESLGTLSPEWSPLAPVLLLAGLSLLEVARNLDGSVMDRCELAEATMSVLLGWQAITCDPHWVPLCLVDLITSLEVANETRASPELAGLTTRLRNQLCVQHTPFATRGRRLGNASTAASLGLDCINCPTCIGYCIRQLWSLAALDELYQHGVRQLSRLRNVDFTKRIVASWKPPSF